MYINTNCLRHGAWSITRFFEKRKKLVLQWKESEGLNKTEIGTSERVEITYFSIEENGNIKYGSRAQLHSCSEPEQFADLGRGFESFVNSDLRCMRVEHILHSLIEESFDVDGQADVITSRHNLVKIGKAPYESQDDWEIDYVLLDNTLFLENRVLTAGSSETDQQRLLEYYHHRFKSLCTGLSKAPLSFSPTFFSMSHLQLGIYNILLSSEIDCIAKDQD